MKEKVNTSPGLSICIPTCNRKHFLENLIAQLAKLIISKNLDIEVCVSDNYSEDGTWEFLKEIAAKHPSFIIQQQDRNIGADRNQIAVANLASSKWILVMGDDDLVVETNLINLLEELPSLEKYDFILLNTKISAEQNLINLDHGVLTSSQLKKNLKKSTSEYGFIGSHLMSRKVVAEKSKRNYKDLRGWSGFATFIYSSTLAEIYFYSKPIVWQDANGQAMTWQYTHWFQLTLRMLQVLIDSSKESRDLSFSKEIITGNLFSINFFRNFYASFLYKEHETFAVINGEEYIDVASLMPPHTRFIHKILCSMIFRIPTRAHHFFVQKILKKDLEKYIFNGEIDQRDGIKNDPDILVK
jgi:glycosyltransferase involved in cell wall biosynthesis